MTTRSIAGMALVAILALMALARAEPAGGTGDPTLDALLHHAESQPMVDVSTRPATQPQGVFAEKTDPNKRAATLTLSTGERISGEFFTTTDQPIRIFDNAHKEFRDIAFADISSIKANVLWERMELEWKFAESGLDQKIYSGKAYPARETEYTIALNSGEAVSGGVVAPLYLDTDGGQRIFILHKRDKGPVGKVLKDLVYVQLVEFAR